MKKISSLTVGREELTLTVETSDSGPVKLQWFGIGDLEFLKALDAVRNQCESFEVLAETAQLLDSWGGNSPFELMLREVILKANENWKHPYTDSELCHCRMVATELVDTAIIAGAHTSARVSRQTNASTQCGTCRPDVEAILAYRLNGFT